MVTTEERSPEVLDTWEVTVPLPERPSFGRNRFRPTEEARLSAARRRLRAAGHAKDEVDGQSSDCGPADCAADHGCGPRDDDDEGDPWAHALARVRGVLARARRWQAWLDEDEGRTAAELARREGVSKARVSQVRRLLDLEPSILADLDRPDRAGPVPSELVLRRIAALPTAEAQRSRYAAVCTPAAPTSGGVRRRDDPGRTPPPRREDFQHVLARARRYQGWLDDGTHPTLASIARAEGISATRVGQLLALLHLDLEIIEVLERPREALPTGLTRRAVRELARLRGHEAQRAAFSVRWPGVLGRPTMVADCCALRATAAGVSLFPGQDERDEAHRPVEW